MRVRIDKSGQHNTPASINNLRAARVPLDSIARSDDVDLPVGNQHSTIANDREIRHIAAYARLLRSRQRDQLRSVKNGQ